MLSNISIHQLIEQDPKQWLVCADRSNYNEIICGTDQGMIYQTQTSTNYKQLLG